MIASLSREQILRRFEEWLERALAEEAPPTGIDAEILSALAAEAETDGEPEGAGSFALWAAVTALTQEVKLQGRAFQELSAALGAQPSRIADEIRVEHREREREAERRCRKDILGALLDLRDRLERGLESSWASAARMEKARRGWWRRLIAGKRGDAAASAVAALIKGYELGIERLDQTLDDFNARLIHCLGEPFDPRRMNAIDKEESGSVREGTVLEVYRNGYEWNGEVFRPAQVKVSVTPTGGMNE